MSVAVDVPAAARLASRRRRRAVWALAGVEGRRLLRHPLVLAGAVASLAVFGKDTWSQAPVLQFDDVLLVGTMLWFAAGVFLAANLAALRSRRHRTDELYEGMPVERSERVLGHLLSIAWPAAAAAVLVGGQLLYLVALGSVGTPSTLELLACPAIVAVLGALGVFLAVWLPSTFVAAVVAVVVAAAQVVLLGQAAAGVQITLTGHMILGQPRVAWLGLWVPEIAAPEVLSRPTAWHLVYFLALAGALGAGSLVRLDARRARAVLAVAVAVAVLAGMAETRPVSAMERAALSARVLHPARFEVCRRSGSVRYCAFPGYAGWIPRWERVVQGVLADVPASVRDRGFTVRQFIWDFGGDVTPGLVRAYYDADFGPLVRSALGSDAGVNPGTQWGRAAAGEAYDLGLALETASKMVGLATSPTSQPSAVMGCQAYGQARGVVSLWLAGESTPGAGTVLAPQQAANPELQSEHGYIAYQGDATWWLSQDTGLAGGGSAPAFGYADAAYALQLMARPRAEVRSVIDAHWAELTDPSAPSSLVVRLLGLRPVPTPAEWMRSHGASPQTIQDVLSGVQDTTPACR